MVRCRGERRAGGRARGIARFGWWLVVWGVCAGCPSGEAPAAPRPEVGRRYRFALGGEGELTQVYEVQSVTPSEVVYTVTTARGEQEVGEPVRLSFSRLREAPPGGSVPIRAGGRQFACRVEEREGLAVYVAEEGGRVAFPGVIKVQDGDAPSLQLVSVEP